jgi:hypothetical protein
MEPRFCGSASPVEAGCGFTTSSMVGAVLPHPVWQGSAWSRSWSSFWSSAKQGLTKNPVLRHGVGTRCWPGRYEAMTPWSESRHPDSLVQVAKSRGAGG